MTEHAGGRDTAAVEINGPALRHIRVLTGVEAVSLSASLGVSRAYLTKIELGYSKRVSGQLYRALCGALGIRDLRVLMVNPNVGSTEDAA